jgi:phospholipase D1/2
VSTPTQRVLDSPATCWRIAQAGRVAFVVDGENYYRAVREALDRAERSVFVIGWDFNHRMRLHPREPESLGQFRASLVGR